MGFNIYNLPVLAQKCPMRMRGEMNWLVAARVVQGLGGGVCLTLTTVIISDITTLRERPGFLAICAFAWALGTNIGVGP